MAKTFKLEKLGKFKAGILDCYAFYNEGIDGIDYFSQDILEGNVKCISVSLNSLRSTIRKYTMMSTKDIKNKYEEILQDILELNETTFNQIVRQQSFEEELWHVGVLTGFKDFEFGVQY